MRYRVIFMRYKVLVFLLIFNLNTIVKSNPTISQDQNSMTLDNFSNELLVSIFQFCLSSDKLEDIIINLERLLLVNRKFSELILDKDLYVLNKILNNYIISNNQNMCNISNDILVNYQKLKNSSIFKIILSSLNIEIINYALILAVINKDYLLVKFFLNNFKCNINFLDNNNRTCLFYAVQNLCDKIEENKNELPNIFTILKYTIYQKDIEIIELLLNTGATVNIINHEELGHDILQSAIDNFIFWDNQYIVLYKKLLDNTKDLNLKENYSRLYSTKIEEYEWEEEATQLAHMTCTLF